MARYQPLDFFEELEALDSDFLRELEQMELTDALEAERLALDKIRRANNLQKAIRIYPRLKAVENFHSWNNTHNVDPSFFDELMGRRNTERVKATKKLYLKRERIRMYLRALYNYWAFDIPIPWDTTKWMGLKYSRHRKAILKLQRRFLSESRKRRHLSKIRAKELKREKQREAQEHLKALASDAGLKRLREESWYFSQQGEILERPDPN